MHRILILNLTSPESNINYDFVKNIISTKHDFIFITSFSHAIERMSEYNPDCVLLMIEPGEINIPHLSNTIQTFTDTFSTNVVIYCHSITRDQERLIYEIPVKSWVDIEKSPENLVWTIEQSLCPEANP